MFNSTINIYDVKNIKHTYTLSAVLLISRYSDTIVVIKKNGNDYVHCTGNFYSKQIPLSHDELYDLYDTSATIFAFHHQVFKTVSIANFEYTIWKLSSVFKKTSFQLVLIIKKNSC